MVQALFSDTMLFFSPGETGRTNMTIRVVHVNVETL